MKKVLSVLLACMMLLPLALPFGGVLKTEANAALAGSFRTGDYIYYGSYPQMEITSSTLKSALAERDTNENGDLWFEGAHYRRAKVSGVTRFFLWTPIKWRVLSCGEDGLFVMAEDILDYRQYYTSDISITWENCAFRSWLNNTFYQLAFTDTEKSGIRNAKIVNDNNPDHGTNGGNDTWDRVFIPSYYDIVNTQYGFVSSTGSSATRKAVQTSYASSRSKDATNYWWLRTPGPYSYEACAVASDGVVSYYYSFHHPIYVSDTLGVRPALKLNLNSVISESERASISSDKFEIRVVNSAGAPVNNASVTVKDSINQTKTVKTGADGVAKFSGGGVGAFSYGDLDFTVSAANYATASSAEGNIAVRHGDYMVVTLYAKGEADYKLSQARYINTDASYNVNISLNVNLLSEMKRLSLSDKNGHFKIECAAKKPSTMVKYQLYQGDKLIQETADGVFKCSVSQFSVGGNCRVVVTTKDGKKVGTNLNLEFTKDVAQKTTSMKLGGDKLSFTVSSDVPLFGGSAIDFDLPDLPIEYYLEDSKMYVALNAKLNNDGDVPISEQVKKFQDALENVANAKDALGRNSQILQQMVARKDGYNMPLAGKFNLTIAGAGEMEWNGDLSNKTMTLKAYFIADAKATKKWQTTVVVPVAIKFTVGIKVYSPVQGVWNFENSSYNADWSVDISPSIALQACVGLGDAIGAGAYGSLSSKISIQILGTSISPGLKAVDLTGELGIKAYAGPFEYKKPFKYQTWHLYTRKANKAPLLASNKSGSLDDMYDMSAYTLQDLSYLENESAWLGENKAPVRVKAAKASAGDPYYTTPKTLISSTYRNAKPLLAAGTEDTVLVFMSADAERGVHNAQKLVSSVFNADSYTWSAPVQVDTNVTADANPFVYSADEGIYLAYQDTAEVYDENSFSEAAYTSAQNIAVAKFNTETKSFDTEKTFANDGAYYRNPCLTEVDGVPTLVWLSSANSDIFGQGSDTEILYAQFMDGEWTDAAVLSALSGSVRSMTAGAVNGKLAALVVTDTDNDFATDEDAVVRLVTAEDNTVIHEGSASSLAYEKLPGASAKSFVFIADEILYSVNGTEKNIVTENIGTPGSIAFLDDRLVFDIINDGKAQIYTAEYDAASASFGEPVAMTDMDAYVGNITAVTADDTDIVVLTKKNVTVTDVNVDDDTDLVWLTLGERDDIAVTNVYYLGQDVEPGSALPIYIDIENRGTSTVKNVKITATNSNGTIVSEKTSAVNLLPGESTEFATVCEMTSCASQEDYVVTVTDTAEVTDAAAGDNSYTITVGKADAEVSCDMMRVGNHNFCAAVVKNNGINPIGGVLDIYSDENTELPLTSIPVDKLGAGESKVVYYDFNESDFTKDSVVITTVFTGDCDELYDTNNTATATLRFADNKMDVCGVQIISEATSLKENETLSLNGEVIPSDADNNAVNWTSSDDSIASVDSEGLVTAHNPGQVTITCTTAENGFTDAVVITVGCDHAYTETRVEPDCVNDGSVTKVCLRCGENVVETIPATGHTEEKLAAVPATCVATGLTEGKHCTVCDTVTLEQTAVPAKGHALALTKTENATCMKAGTQYYKCTVCGYEETKEIAPLGHSFVENVAGNTAPTCTTPGTKAFVCTRCDAVTSENLGLSGHTIMTDIAVAPTCITSGLTEGGHCSVCGLILTPQTVIRATGHNYVDDAAVPATCTEDGWTAGKHCENCGKVAKEPVLIPAVGHTTENTACTEDQLCTVCGEVVREAGEHTAAVIPGIKATCTTAGSTDGEICSLCGAILQAPEVIPADGHDYGETVIAPTCIKEGYTQFTCKKCGDTYTDRSTSHLGHSYVMTMTDPTCTESGTSEMRCTVCGEGYQTVIPASGHLYFSITVEPTCTKEGYTRHICAKCGDEYQDSVISATGHSIYEEVIKPTCTENGCNIHICSVCGYNYTDSVVKAPGHSPAVLEEIAPTCISNGVSAGSYCTVCQEILEPQKLIPCTAHADKDEDGYCDLCGSPVQSGDCGCVCHHVYSGPMAPFYRFFYKVINYFWKMFGIKKVCECGIQHW